MGLSGVAVTVGYGDLLCRRPRRVTTGSRWRARGEFLTSRNAGGPNCVAIFLTKLAAGSLTGEYIYEQPTLVYKGGLSSAAGGRSWPTRTPANRCSAEQLEAVVPQRTGVDCGNTSTRQARLNMKASLGL